MSKTPLGKLSKKEVYDLVVGLVRSCEASGVAWKRLLPSEFPEELEKRKYSSAEIVIACELSLLLKGAK